GWHVPHRDIENAVRLVRRVHGDDVGVVDGYRGPRLANEPLTELPVPGERRREDLQRHGPPEPHVLGAEYDGHSPGPDPLLHSVSGYHGTRSQPPAEAPRRLPGHRFPPQTWLNKPRCIGSI